MMLTRMSSSIPFTSRRLFLKYGAALIAAPPCCLHAAPIHVPTPAEIDLVTGEFEAARLQLQRQGSSWSAKEAEVTLERTATDISVHVQAPKVPVRHLHIRWKVRTPAAALVLGDAWERSYGDLAWLPIDPARAMPWYCFTHSAAGTRGYGVKTGAKALAFWQVDSEGISLWLDLLNGGGGTWLGDRILHAATIVTADGDPSTSAFQVAQMLCRKMANDSVPRRMQPLLATNDWYYAYGKNQPANILRDAELLAELQPRGLPAYTVIDDGYQDRHRFPDMVDLAAKIARIGPAPGLWIRPLRPPKGVDAKLLLPVKRWGSRKERIDTHAYDPTIPEANAAAIKVAADAVGWGYRLLKHDFTTYELLGQWGNEMGATPTVGQWHFNDRTKTNAEILYAFYRDLRAAAGHQTVLQGCNTVGHLSVGLFDTSRTGDDVSGLNWERTRRMGPNTLAFRLPQHKTFFLNDPDCIPITAHVSWEQTRQWMEAIAAAGVALTISADAALLTEEKKNSIRDAFALVASNHAHSVPLDWMTNRTPERWSGGKHFHWSESSGADPFPV